MLLGDADARLTVLVVGNAGDVAKVLRLPATAAREFVADRVGGVAFGAANTNSACRRVHRGT